MQLFSSRILYRNFVFLLLLRRKLPHICENKLEITGIALIWGAARCVDSGCS